VEATQGFTQTAKVTKTKKGVNARRNSINSITLAPPDASRERLASISFAFNGKQRDSPVRVDVPTTQARGAIV
jgi:hypothetical protein